MQAIDNVSQLPAPRKVKKFCISENNRVTIEEKFFNTSYEKVIEGTKRRCGKLTFTEIPNESSLSEFVTTQGVIFKSILSRLIGQRKKFSTLGSGKQAVITLTAKFQKELKVCMDRWSIPGSMLLKKDIFSIDCVLVSYSPSSACFEGTQDIELFWFAQQEINGQTVTRSILHPFNSSTDKRVQK